MRRLAPPTEPAPDVLSRGTVVECLRAIAADGVDGYDARTRTFRFGSVGNSRHPAWEALRDGLPGTVPTLYGILVGGPIDAHQVDELADRLLVEADQ